MPLTLEDLRTAEFSSISTDTRTLTTGALFVALVSDKANGHDHIKQAIEKGAAGLVVSQTVSSVPDGLPVYQVADTEIAYGQLARAWRDKFDIPVIGVTGSVGKTTVKEMLAAALSPLGQILKTQASQNNETGVPKTLLQLTPNYKAAVIEMGMRGAGQIAYLCEIARPTLGVITLIGENHIELLGSRDAIADAKGELLEALPADGIAVLNADDPYFPRLAAKTAARIVSVSAANAQAVPSPDGGWQFTVADTKFEIASPSRHDVSNALLAIAVARELGVPLTKIAEALKAYVPPPMRMEILKTGRGGIVLNDAYNAAPASVKSALQTLKATPGTRHLAFLGEMRELGAQSPELHRELGDAIAELGGLDALYTVGELAAHIPGATRHFADSEEAAAFARSEPYGAGDVILVKGSRAVKMERVAEGLTAR